MPSPVCRRLRALLPCLLAGAWLTAGCGEPPAATADAADGAGVDGSAADTADGAATDAPGFDGHLLRLPPAALQTAADGLSPAFEFQVPPGTTSLVVTLRGPAALQYQLAALEGPGGYVVVPKGWLDFSPQPWLCLDGCPNRVAAAPAVASFLVPNTPGISVTPGTWRLRGYAFDYQPAAGQRTTAAVPLQVQVDFVSRPQPAQARLDLNLCLTGALGLQADLALQHPRIVQALDDAAELLAQAGIALGEVRAFDVAAPSLLIAHDSGADGEIGQLFATGKGLPLGLNVFLVESIYRAGEQPGMAPIAGLAGGIPGPPLEVGSPRSGVVLSLQLTAGADDTLGRVLAHEIAHFLGLFHTSEQPADDGQVVHDTLPDTGEDDADNLMYWQPTKGQGKLSAEQAAVLQRNPWLVPLPTAGGGTGEEP